MLNHYLVISQMSSKVVPLKVVINIKLWKSHDFSLDPNFWSLIYLTEFTPVDYFLPFQFLFKVVLKQFDLKIQAWGKDQFEYSKS